MQNYIKDPNEIYKKSFDIISSEVNLEPFDNYHQKLITRVIHSCGDTSVLDDLFISKYAISEGLKSIRSDCKILTDSEMVRAGVMKKNLPRNKVECFLNNKDVQRIASMYNTTRSAAAVNLWKNYIKNSIIIIGNAPTALFRLIEIIKENNFIPSLIIAMPLGFVGAVESKEELIDLHNSLNLNIITIRGRRGGSAMACAAMNAIGLIYNNE